MKRCNSRMRMYITLNRFKVETITIQDDNNFQLLYTGNIFFLYLNSII